MLQSLATKKAIDDLGHDCEIVRYKKCLSIPEKVKQVPRLLNGANIRSAKKQSKANRLESAYPTISALREERQGVFERFREEAFTDLSEEFVGYEALKRGSTRYDAVVVGSDQMWLPQGLPTNFYNLQFAAPGVRRVSYATSFGVSSIPWYQRSRTAEYLRKIDYLSVRENTGAVICSEVAGLEAKVVVDPTLLHTRERWADIVPIDKCGRGPYIFCYFLGSNPICRLEANRLSRETGLPIVTLRHLDEIVPSDESFGDEAPYDIMPTDFVNLIRNAEYVLTDSFHGTVFSTIHHKRFATFYRFAQGDKHSRNSRIDSLFSHLNLHDRLIVEPGRICATVEESINFGIVEACLAEWRENSWAFLKEALC